MTLDPREESEFCCVPVSLVSSTYQDMCENHLSVTRTTEFYQKTGTLVLIASVNRELMECLSEKATRPKEVDMTSSLFSRLWQIAVHVSTVFCGAYVLYKLMNQLTNKCIASPVKKNINQLWFKLFIFGTYTCNYCIHFKIASV